MLNADAAIDVSEFAISKDQTTTLYMEVVNESPELFYVSSSLSYVYSYSSEYSGFILKTIKPVYSGTKDEITQQKQAFEDSVEEIAKNLNFDASDLAIATQIHDYVVTHCKYGSTSQNVSHSAYGAIVNKTPVCDGYALAYRYLVKRYTDLDCVCVTSDKMAHAWNMLQVGDSYYHVDLTWDDPVGVSDPNYCEHSNFLCSDTYMNGDSDSYHYHHDWLVNGITCGNTKYDDCNWKVSEAAFGLDDNLAYYCDDSYDVYCYNLVTDKDTMIETGLTYNYDVKYANNKLYILSHVTESGIGSKYTIECYDLSTKKETRLLVLQETNVVSIHFDEDGFLNYNKFGTTYKTDITGETNPDINFKMSSNNIDLYLFVGGTTNYQIKCDPYDDSYLKYIGFYSNNSSIASIDNSGTVTGESQGTTYISAEFQGQKITCRVTVMDPYDNGYNTYYNGVDYSAVYNFQFYCEKNPDVAQAFNYDPDRILEHFVLYGMGEGRIASRSFDPKVYRMQYSDLSNAFGDNLGSYYYHYMNYGMNEGRTAFGPDFYSMVFNAENYLNRYQDLRQAFGDDVYQAFFHFINYGVFEGRQGLNDFDIVAYRKNNSDLVNAFGNDNRAIIDHFVRYGQYEGRTKVDDSSKNASNMNIGAYSLVFDENYYLAANSDLRDFFGTNVEAAFSHFVNYGQDEGRLAKDTFNVKKYKEYNSDLSSAFGSNYRTFFWHYMNFGVYEDRPCC